MGLKHRNYGVLWFFEMDSQPRSKGSNDYRRSPNIGGRSPSLMRSSSPKRFRNRLSDSDYNISCYDSDDRCSNRNHLRGGKHVVTCDKCDNSEKKGCESNRHSNDTMALSAVMLSGGGGSGLKKGSSQRNLSDLEHEQGNINSWQSGCPPSRDSRSHSVSPSSSKCNCDRARSKETVIINVGGNVFETFRSTLKRFKTCKLADEREMLKYFRPDKGDYFFDRDPYAFNIIMNYLRYGDLHLPTNLCGPALMREFQYWGIDEQEIERCCFQPYNTWKTQTKSLEKLEYDRKQSTTQTDLAHDRKSKSVWRRLRAVIWPFLQDPSSSVAAKIYAWISIIFVCLSIFSFCAETHPYFQLPPSEVHDLRVLYKFFALEDSQVITRIHHKATINDSTASNFSDVAGDNNTDVDPEQTVQHPALLVIDLICVLFFSLEFLTRLIFCPKKLRFCTSLQNIIDFIAIVPDYVEFVLLAVSPQVRSGLSFVDFIFILRMLRLCRIFRLIRHVPGLWILLYTLKASFNELLLMFVFLLIGMVMFASLLHFTEGGGQFSNIPVGFWWAVVTMTTVGYGDMYPTSAFGYFIGSICAISGLLMIAFTVPIIVSNFVLYYTHVQYGISEKDEREGMACDIIDDIETCSYHTSCSGSINDVHRNKGLVENSPTSETDVNLTEFSNALRSTSDITSQVFDKDDNSIPMKITDSNSNKL
ncbi:potassium voltage-gated channel protein Shaw-like isoform X3 [Ruditapes philippinarum]|uniref:potassium voltage-gated channel protein Shaw-like isoform X3 n=1 Tax=Ruditapes philippinarum TaxID=129788 RepID=UPI00295BD2FA|nr:potassium voltage-gated channel protein Shaw-like isoform X3 [Ruditapes philippinarum]